MGFTDVADYVGGKEDWLAAGWPREGHAPDHRLAGDVVRDVATCTVEERAGDVLERVDPDLRFAIAVADDGVVVGKLLARHAEEHADASTGDLMVEGPTTVRASEDVEALAERMADAGTSSVVVTTKEGRLLGVLHLDDVDGGS